MTVDLTPADLDAIEAVGRRVRGIAILPKADLLSLVALARQAARLRGVVLPLEELALEVERAIDAKDQGWPGGWKIIRDADRRYRAARAALAEPAPEGGQ